jgi:hypothetical protein
VSVTRYDEVGDFAGYEGEWVGPRRIEKPDGQSVHYSDYEKLVDALREIRSLGPLQLAGEIAEAALLSNGEEL